MPVDWRKAPMPEWEDATKEEGFGETRGSTCAGARSARERQERAKSEQIIKVGGH